MTLTKKITWLTLFSIAMGFMETVIVVYLRKLYYPRGFDFPLVAMDMDILKTEFLREAATVIMLLAIGILAGKTAVQRFAYFIFCFAIWDIFYYIFLKVLLNWPESLFTWDILFLIPLPWVGPVVAPCIISFTMIGLAYVIIYLDERYGNAKIIAREWWLFIAGSLVVIFSFILVTLKGGLFNINVPMIPQNYNWPLFWIGELLIIFGGAIYFWRIKNRICQTNLSESV